MTPAPSPHPRWDDIKRLFDEVADLEAAAREACLASADPELAGEVRSLLHWHDGSTGFLESPPDQVAELARDALIGQAIGPWHIVRVIGHGGMGVVYHAERADAAFTRQAAVKVIGANADAAGVVERFQRERQTLADLDHRNIARLLDGGTTPGGQPYFVMEFVDGEPIDRYCDTRHLSIDDRLELFLRVCNGVQYAHENLVVHRDIKPDNILVTDDATPKLLDFGVARLLHRGAAAGDQGESSATWLMTPDFASPEQLEGKASTTGTDVYSLGVVLYVLLTGERPYRLHGTTPGEILARLAASSTVPPSVRAVEGPTAVTRAEHRGTTPAALARTLAGDLDAIVARALALSPADRYHGVTELVRDVKAYRTSLPVSARPATAGYLVGKFVRRYRRRVVAATLVAGLGAGGVAAVAWQASVAARERARAERRFDDVRQLANAFMFEVNDTIANVPGTMATRELIVKTTVEYLDSLARESADDPSLMRELARAWIRVGDVQGNPTNANLGDAAGALRSYERAVALAESAGRAEPGDTDALRALATAHRRLADVTAWSGAITTALTHNAHSREMYDAVAQRTGTFDDRFEAAIFWVKQGDLVGNPNLPNAGRAADAAAAFESGIEAFRALDREQPGDIRVQRFIGVSLERLGTLHEAAGRWEEAAAAYRASYDIRQSLADREPSHRNIQRDLAIAHEKLGKVADASGDTAAGIRSLRLALEQFERLAALDTADANATRSVAISREVLGRVLLKARQLPEAQRLFEGALTTHEGLAARDGSSSQSRCDAARLHELIADTLAADAAAAPKVCAQLRASAGILDALQAAGTPCSPGQSGENALQDKLRACR
jgi:tetratricopeptide (TPR) repeat protein